MRVLILPCRPSPTPVSLRQDNLSRTSRSLARIISGYLIGCRYCLTSQLSIMDTTTSWLIVPRGDHSSSPEGDGQSSSSTATEDLYGNTDTLAGDLFQDKFMTLARGGSNGEKIMRGFLIGVAVGLIVACFVCCWYPCCRPDRRRRRGPRRPPVSEEEQESASSTTPPDDPATAPATTPADAPTSTPAPASTPTIAPVATPAVAPASIPAPTPAPVPPS